MRRESSRASSDRVGNGIGRTLFAQADDTKLLQETQLNLFSGEQQQTIEHAHPYGFTMVPQAPTQGAGGKQKGAEAFTGFISGNRSHGVAFLVADRRYRLYKLKDGEVALHDDQGHQVHITRDGIVASAPKSKKIVAQIMSDDTMPQESGKQYGQIAQAGRPVLASFTLDKNSFTVTHPVAINLTAPNIVHNGITFLGGADANNPLAMGPGNLPGTVDTMGNMDVANLATKAFTK